jgi:hypothetical protein
VDQTLDDAAVPPKDTRYTSPQGEVEVDYFHNDYHLHTPLSSSDSGRRNVYREPVGIV